MPHRRKEALQQWLVTTLNISKPQLQPVCGDASFRQYYRIQLSDQSLIVVDSPVKSQKNHEFALYSALLLQVKLKVPKVLAIDYHQGFICLSDLGDELLFSKLNNTTIHHWYQKALSLLPALQSIDNNAAHLPLFDTAFIEQENQIFSQWLLEQHLGLSLNTKQQILLNNTFAHLVENNLAQPQVPVHRDFHSRNLMLVNDDIAIIDFQDMVLGPITYDAVSLLRDCYCRWPAQEIEQLKQHYFELCQLSTVSWEQFSTWFDLTGLQRHIKAAGIFARLHHRDGKTQYLKDIPRTLDYIIDIAEKYPQLLEFSQLVKTIKTAFTQLDAQQNDKS